MTLLAAALALVAAVMARPDDPTAKPLPDVPWSYVLDVSATDGGVAVSINGFRVLTRREGDGAILTLPLNGFLKRGANALAIEPIEDGGAPVRIAATLRRHKASGGAESVETVFDAALPKERPSEREIGGAPLPFETRDTPPLAFWSAEPAPLDDAAKAAIAQDISRRAALLNAALDAKDTGAIVAFLDALPMNRDAVRFMGPGAAEAQAATLADVLAPPVNDPKPYALARAPSPRLEDLAFERVGDHVVVSRKDGGSMLGFLYAAPDGPGGVTIDRPVYGRVNGVWTLLQDLRL